MKSLFRLTLQKRSKEDKLKDGSSNLNNSSLLVIKEFIQEENSFIDSSFMRNLESSVYSRNFSPMPLKVNPSLELPSFGLELNPLPSTYGGGFRLKYLRVLIQKIMTLALKAGLIAQIT